MQKVFRFNGIFINCYVENDVVVIGIGDDDVDPSNFIIVSRLDESEGLNERVNNNIGLQTSFSAFESCAAIKSVRLKARQLKIEIRPDKANKVGASEIDIVLTPEDAAIKDLVKYLHLVFDDAGPGLDIDIPPTHPIDQPRD